MFRYIYYFILPIIIIADKYPLLKRIYSLNNNNNDINYNNMIKNIPKLLNINSLNSTYVNTFQYYTFKTRLPAVIDQVIQDNVYHHGHRESTNDIDLKLLKLKDDFQNSYISCELLPCYDNMKRSLSNSDFYNHCQDWKQFLHVYCLNNITYQQAIPPISIEILFYRQLLNVVGYFKHHKDPFSIRKHELYHKSLSYIEKVVKLVNKCQFMVFENESKCLIQLIKASLVGNEASDLALDPINSISNMDETQLWNYKNDSKYTLVNETLNVVRYLLRERDSAKVSFSKSTRSIGIMLDNCGAEFVSDLSLIVFLLDHKYTDRIYLYPKYHPVFVSDVVSYDLKMTRIWLSQSSNIDMKAFSKRLNQYFLNGKIVNYNTWFTTSPLMFYSMPSKFVKHISEHQLLIIKGDANYRRLLGDLQWQHHKYTFDNVVQYMPCSILALRCVKSELYTSDYNHIPNDDSNWQQTGEYCGVQFSEISYSTNTNNLFWHTFLGTICAIIIASLLLWKNQ